MTSGVMFVGDSEKVINFPNHCTEVNLSSVSLLRGRYLTGLGEQSTRGGGASAVLSAYSRECQSCSWGPEHAGFHSI